MALAGPLAVALAFTISSPAAALDDPLPNPSSSIASVSTEPPSATGSGNSRPSLAEEAEKKCKPRSFFRFHSFKPNNFFIPRTRFIDGPGGTMAVSVTRQHKVYAVLEIERERLVEIDRNGLIRQLRNNVNPLVAEEHVVEAGHEYSQKISDGMYGNMWYRVFGYRVGFSAWRRVYDCRVHKVATGIANVPARVEGWRYWETRHPMYRGRRLSRR